MKNYYVISKSGRNWRIDDSNHYLSGKIFNTQKEAIDTAKQIISKKGGVVSVHNANGAIKEVIIQSKIQQPFKTTNISSKKITKQDVFKAMASKLEKENSKG